MKIEPWGKMSDGTPVDLCTLESGNGVTVKVTSYAATMTSVAVPDSSGRADGILLGYGSLDAYVDLGFGQLIGRYANRIANGHVEIDGTVYQISVNKPPHTLHGGFSGFSHKVWQVEPADGEAVKLTYRSPDGDEGFPGNLTASVVYTLAPDNVLRLDFSATTDKPTVVNLTDHPYWNLCGAGSGSVLEQLLMVNADRYTPTDADGIPTGEIADVSGTPLDFRSSTPLGARLKSGADDKYHISHGYDNNFVLNRAAPGEMVLAARLEDPISRRVLEISSTQPGLQLYTGNSLHAGAHIGNGGRSYQAFDGVAMECEAFPDSPNHPNFPSTLLRPGQTYRQTTTYRFTTK